MNRGAVENRTYRGGKAVENRTDNYHFKNAYVPARRESG